MRFKCKFLFHYRCLIDFKIKNVGRINYGCSETPAIEYCAEEANLLCYGSDHLPLPLPLPTPLSSANAQVAYQNSVIVAVVMVMRIGNERCSHSNDDRCISDFVNIQI